MRLTYTTGLVLATALLAAGCSGDDNKDADEPSTSSTSSADPGIISPDLPDIPEFRGKGMGIVADTEMTDCTTEPGDVTAEGVATNSAKTEKDIVIVVSWTTSTSDVVARGVTAVENVAPGDDVDWNVGAELEEESPVQCVLTATAGTLK